ncbi:MAG: hypothetical protein LIP03_03530 [Bacteroidales bacterium]|nr:hypothetical protein [Bacteroidales bacterium]
MNFKSIYNRLRGFWTKEQSGPNSPYLLTNAVNAVVIGLSIPVLDLSDSLISNILNLVVFDLVVGGIALGIFCKLKKCSIKKPIPARRFWLMAPIVFGIVLASWLFTDSYPIASLQYWILYALASIVIVILLQYLAFLKPSKQPTNC